MPFSFFRRKGVTVFSLIAKIIRQDPIVVAPYAAYALLTYLLTAHFGAVFPTAPVKAGTPVPYLMLTVLILGDFLARGMTLSLVSTQFKNPSKQSWSQWWGGYFALSLAFFLVYLGLASVFWAGPPRLASLGILGMGAVLILGCLSIVLILVAPLLMFFRGVGIFSAVYGTLGLLRRRPALVIRVVLMTISLLFFFAILGMTMAGLPVLGMTLSYLLQALGQTVALVYTFVVLGDAELSRGVWIGPQGSAEE